MEYSLDIVTMALSQQLSAILRIAHIFVIVIVLVLTELPHRTAAAILVVVIQCECIIDR